MDIKQHRDETLEKTIDILNQMSNEVEKIEFKLMQCILINDVLEKVARAWMEAGDIYNVAMYVDDIKQYTAQPYMHRYKLGELIVHLNEILHPKKKTFNLN